MPMDKHRCKLCSRSFLNGRALGGHMRSHLASLPLPPKKNTQEENESFNLGVENESDSSSTRSENECKPGFYELRGNPKKSVKALDPEFLDAASIVVQDRESETESTQNPTRKRSKRVGQRSGFEPKKCKWVVVSESTTESNPASSVSDPSQDEEVALCLMLLSRDVWDEKSIDSKTGLKKGTAQPMTRPATTRPAARFKCFGCKKVFRTGRALAGHKASNKECCQENSVGFGDDHVGQKIFECPFCSKVFGSGQALGGHKRSHLIGTSTNNNITVASTNNNEDDNNNNNFNVSKVGDTTSFILDLNLPAPVDDDEDYSGQFNFVGSA